MSCRFLKIRTSRSSTSATTYFIDRGMLFSPRFHSTSLKARMTLFSLPRSEHLDHPTPVAHHLGHSFHILGGQTHTLFLNVKVLMPNSSLLAGLLDLGHTPPTRVRLMATPWDSTVPRTQFSLNYSPTHAVTPRRYVCMGLGVSSPSCRVAGFQVEQTSWDRSRPMNCPDGHSNPQTDRIEVSFHISLGDFEQTSEAPHQHLGKT